jgi:hypothetical protein
MLCFNVHVPRACQTLLRHRPLHAVPINCGMYEILSWMNEKSSGCTFLYKGVSVPLRI